nr:hypothetical protein [Sphingomonas bacterium]
MPLIALANIKALRRTSQGAIEWSATPLASNVLICRSIARFRRTTSVEFGSLKSESFNRTVVFPESVATHSTMRRNIARNWSSPEE